MLPDANAKEPVQRREGHLDRPSGRRGVGRVGAVGGDVAASQLRYRERPAHQAEGLHQGGGGAHDDRRDRQRRRRFEHHRQQRDEGQHRDGGQEQGLPSQDQPRAARGEPPQDLVGLLAQDVRVVECAAKLDERKIERDGTAISNAAVTMSTVMRPRYPCSEPSAS